MKGDVEDKGSSSESKTGKILNEFADYKLEELVDNAKPSDDHIQSSGLFSRPIVVPELPYETSQNISEEVLVVEDNSASSSFQPTSTLVGPVSSKLINDLTTPEKEIISSAMILNSLQAGISLVNAEAQAQNEFSREPETGTISPQQNDQSVEVQKSVEIYHSGPVHEIHYYPVNQATMIDMEPPQSNVNPQALKNEVQSNPLEENNKAHFDLSQPQDENAFLEAIYFNNPTKPNFDNLQILSPLANDAKNNRIQDSDQETNFRNSNHNVKSNNAYQQQDNLHVNIPELYRLPVNPYQATLINSGQRNKIEIVPSIALNLKNKNIQLGNQRLNHYKTINAHRINDGLNTGKFYITDLRGNLRHNELGESDQAIESTIELPASSNQLETAQASIEKVIEKTVHVPHPIPLDRVVEKKVPVPIEKIIEKQVSIPQPVPVPVHVPVQVPVERLIEKHVSIPQPYPIHIEKVLERRIPVPLQRIILQPVPVHMKLPQQVPYTIEKRVPVPVEKIVEKKVQIPHPYPVEIEKMVVRPKPVPVEIMKIIIKPSSGQIRYNSGHQLRNPEEESWNYYPFNVGTNQKWPEPVVGGISSRSNQGQSKSSGQGHQERKSQQNQARAREELPAFRPGQIRIPGQGQFLISGQGQLLIPGQGQILIPTQQFAVSSGQGQIRIPSQGQIRVPAQGHLVIPANDIQAQAQSNLRRARQPDGFTPQDTGNFRQSKMEYGFKPPMVPSIQYDEKTATKVDN
ncbi:uncharacterized protein [Prorops nasuta]|uniref:uncharacterized protein n=1 Tax=Prorops nasuta TaxID=863751 RepID=UPI0034CF3C42